MLSQWYDYLRKKRPAFKSAVCHVFNNTVNGFLCYWLSINYTIYIEITYNYKLNTSGNEAEDISIPLTEMTWKSLCLQSSAERWVYIGLSSRGYWPVCVSPHKN